MSLPDRIGPDWQAVLRRQYVDEGRTMAALAATYGMSRKPLLK